MATHLEIKVTVQGIKPPIWRQLLVPANWTFLNLGEAILHCGPWSGGHLWQFHTADRSRDIIANFMYPGCDADDFGAEGPDSAKVKLSKFFKAKGDHCVFWYDFGDDWMHEIKLVAVRELEEKAVWKLLAGARNFPPEDCGGVDGYYRAWVASGKCTDPKALDFYKDDEEMQEFREWLGDWDPEDFDLAVAQKQFDGPRVKRRTKRGSAVR